MTLVKAGLGAVLATAVVASTAAAPSASARVPHPWGLPGVPGPLEVPARPSVDPSAFLKQLVGEWTVESETIPGPGQEPVRSESREVARMLGGKWLVAEGEMAGPGGDPVTSILTLGYDRTTERFIGTWISSMQGHLWRYTGTLDESETVLTLETEGPVLGDPTNTARYRDVIEIEGPDRRVMRSLILGPDGEWFEFARAEYRRARIN